MSSIYWQYGETEDVIFKRIDECGGWPHNGKSLVYKHTGELKRPCYFSQAENIRDEWNTSIFTSDQYYWWKLSDKKKQEFKEQIIKDIKVKLSNYINE